MSGLNLGEMASNFAGGALSGYKAVLGKKMEEDYQTQRDEAIANRQANLARLNAELDKPYKDAAVELGFEKLGAEKNQNERMYNLQMQQAKNQAAAQAASAANQARQLSIQEQQAKAANAFREAEANGSHAAAQAAALQAENLRQISDYGSREYQRVFNATKDETQAAAAQATIEALGVKTPKEKSELLSNKDYYATINNVSEKVATTELTRLKALPQDEIIKEATQLGYNPKTTKLTPSAFVVKASVYDAVSAIPSNQPVVNVGAATNKSTSASPTIDLKKPLTGDQLQAIASGSLSGDPDMIDLMNKYKSENPTTYKQLYNVQNTLKGQQSKKEAGLLRGLDVIATP